MIPFASTRSHLARDHALFAPTGHVVQPLSGWTNTEGILLISPQMGARFAQYLAVMQPGGAFTSTAGAPLPGVQRFLFVQSGVVTLSVHDQSHELSTGGYAFLPADTAHELVAAEASRLVLFEKRYQPLLNQQAALAPVIGQEQTVTGEPFLGDEDAVLQTLLPVDPAFDMAVNLFTFAPGAALPFVEVHVMEHGLIFLAGQGIYRLADAWYPVQQDDVIWMASYCPQWFAAIGKTPARYLYYKDIHRDPLQAAGL